MYLSNLFDLIRQEKVILWAGSGMSKYAGYPMGNELAEILFKKLTSEEQSQIGSTLPLSDLTEQIYRIKGNNRNWIVSALKDIFGAPAENNLVHRQLKSIPHIQTIVTTNYDGLFESTYGEHSQVLHNDSHIPYYDTSKTQIFKIHGDLSTPDSLIITTSDYNRFFKDHKDQSTFWSVIREKIATNNVLFVGYNLEDPNTSVVFDRITDSLGENRKECFLVGPDLPQHKVSDLSNKRIHYIDSTSEQLFNELIPFLKETIISDLEEGRVSAETFKDFLGNLDLLPELRAEDTSFKVSSLKGTTDDIEGTIKLSFKNEPAFLKNLRDFQLGKKFGVFDIPKDKLVSVDVRYGGVKFPNSDDFVNFQIQRQPRLEKTIDLRFDDGFEFTDIPCKVYGSPIAVEIHCELSNATINIRIEVSDSPEMAAKMDYRHHDKCQTVAKEIELFELLTRVSKGCPFTVYDGNHPVVTKNFPQQEDFHRNSKELLEYFKTLKRIENAFNLRFYEIEVSDITGHSEDKAKFLNSIINKEELEYQCTDEFTMTLAEDCTDETLDHVKQIHKESPSITIFSQEEETEEIHGQKVSIGYKKVTFENTMVLNLESVLNRKENEVRLKSKNHKMKVSYMASPIPLNQGD